MKTMLACTGKHRAALWALVAAICAGPAMAAAEQPTTLQQLSLDKAIRISLEHNHDLRLSALAVGNANAAITLAGAAPNPSLTLQTMNLNPHAGIGAGGLRDKTVDSTLRIDQLIERGDKRALRTESASHLQQAAQHDLSETRRQLRIIVSQAYYDVLAAQDRQAILQQTAALLASATGAAKKRQQAGDLANADVARLQVDALQAQNDVVQVQADLNKARQTLALVLGQIDAVAQLELSDGWPARPAEAPARPAEFIERHPAVLAARARLDAALAARKLALALRSRDVSVGVQLEHFPTSATNTQGSGNSVGIALQIPLFARYQFDGEIGMAEAAAESARVSLEKARDGAHAEWLKTRAEVEAAAARMARYDDELLAAAKKSADAAEFAFKHGATGVIDVLDARRTYRLIQLDALVARADYAKSLAAWQATLAENTAP